MGLGMRLPEPLIKGSEQQPEAFADMIAQKKDELHWHLLKCGGRFNYSRVVYKYLLLVILCIWYTVMKQDYTRRGQMRFYKVNVLNGETGESWNSWFTNRREAKRYHSKVAAAGSIKIIEQGIVLFETTEGMQEVFGIVEYDIPINKVGLLAWLNLHGHSSIGYH